VTSLNDIIEFDIISAFLFYCQVLVTNQLTTKIGPGNGSHLVPALGDSFGHYSNQRLMLGYLQRGCYGAVLFKSTRRQQSSVKFQVIFICILLVESNMEILVYLILLTSLPFIVISDTEEWYSGLQCINEVKCVLSLKCHSFVSVIIFNAG
jgi:hypothetical protein